MRESANGQMGKIVPGSIRTESLVVWFLVFLGGQSVENIEMHQVLTEKANEHSYRSNFRLLGFVNFVDDGSTGLVLGERATVITYNAERFQAEIIGV